MAKCEALPDEVEAMKKLIETIKSPKSFFFTVGKNILVNGQEIFTDVTGAVSDYQSQNWENFGKEIGDILLKVFIGSDEHISIVGFSEEESSEDDIDTKTAVAETFQGILESLDATISVSSCIGESKEEFAILTKIVQELQSK